MRMLVSKLLFRGDSKYLLALFLLFCVGCTNEKEVVVKHSPKYDVEIKLTEEILKISVDSTTANISNYLTYYYNPSKNEEHLISVNTFMNEIQFFNLNASEYSFTLPIEMNGTKGVGPILAAYVISFDSIVVFPTEYDNIYLLDSSNRGFLNVDYNEPPGYTNARPSILFFSSIPYFQNDKLFVKSLYQTNFRTVSNRQLSKVSLGYSIELSSGKTTLLNHTYPEDYFKYGLKHFDFSASFSDNAFVYSFFGDHNLYVGKNEDDKLRKVYGKSKYLNKELPLFPADGDRLDRSMYLSVLDHYGNIFYDRYRNVYYRFCYPELDIKEIDEIIDNLHNPRKFSIQIFDKDLNIIGETLFDNNHTYLTKNVFVGKEGLYISTKHSQNEDNLENEFAFALFKMKSVQ